ncbi:BRCA1-associated protein [Trypanosoma grayi]|uniref:BRCA1-associated protein n=1 Tax=Trypanosoma grayi TaxID=71804 RepID=UPI0004F4270E|nr:BRCA1-associated protein [Trypanosoma grayi]KEG11690.1 BRCA1-associated protein [Trypanosoma grayi]
MSSAEEPDVVVALDPEGTVVLGLWYKHAEPTRWLLLRAIPVDVTVPQVLQCLEFRSPPQPTGRGSSNDSMCKDPKRFGDEGCLRAARVGYVPGEKRAYCLLLQFTVPIDAEQIKKHFSKTKLTKGAATVTRAVRASARMLPALHVTQCAGSGEGPGRVGEEVDLEALCSVSRSLVAGEMSGSRTRRGVEWTSNGNTSNRNSPVATMGDPCTICLEEITSGKPCIVTLCNHVFHLTCYGRYLEDVCPLCRFSMASLESKCNACGTYTDLWTCLVCGWVGCGQGHRCDHLRHYESTGHSCAMQSTTCRIWNHRAKTFLHHQLAIELGHEDDAKAARAAAADASTSHCFRKDGDDGGGGVTASTYWRSRWWWDEKDEEAALDLNGEYVREYYLKVMRQLMEEQIEYFERRTGLEAESSPPRVAAWRKLSIAEQRQRRRVVSEYVAGTRQIVLHEQMLFNRFVKKEAIRNENLRDELLLQSHSTQNLNNRIANARANIDKAKQRGAQQVAAKENELKNLQEKLANLMNSLD